LRLFKEGPAKNLGKKQEQQYLDSLGRAPWRKQEAPKERRKKTKKQKQPKHPIF